MADETRTTDLFGQLQTCPVPRWIFGEKLSVGGKEFVPVCEIKAEVEDARPAEGDQPGRPARGRVEGWPVGIVTEVDGKVAFIPIEPPCEDDDDDRPPRWMEPLIDKLVGGQRGRGRGGEECRGGHREDQECRGRGREREERDERDRHDDWR
jgi:hypothetical protein